MSDRTNVPTLATCMPGPERMPLLSPDTMDPAQKAAADALIAGPRGAVFGPFVALMRSPELLNRMQKVGEFLRFDSSLPASVSEFVILVVSRAWTQQFEWCMHVPLALKAGVPQSVLDELAQSCRPQGMSTQLSAAYDFTDELLRNHGVSDPTYARAIAEFGERGVVELTSLAGYFLAISMVMNVAHTPPLADTKVTPLGSLPR